MIGLSLLCSKIYLLFLPELPKIFTHYSFFIPIAPPRYYHNAGTTIYNLHSRLCLLTALIEYLTIVLEYLDLLQTRWQGKANVLATPLFETTVSCVSHVSAILVSD